MAGETVLTPAAGVQRRSGGVARGGRREEEVQLRDLAGNCKNLRDFTVNRKFPTDS
jgi:hypothetical protein